MTANEQYSIKLRDELGTTVEFTPTAAKPLGVSQLRELESGARPTIPLEFEADEVMLSGTKHHGKRTFTCQVDLAYPPSIYALVHGGWLPPLFTMPPHFLVDRNVVSRLNSIQLGRESKEGIEFEWWMRTFREGGAKFNPLSYALEAGFRRKPSFSEFRKEFDKGVAEIRGYFPACQITEYSEAHYLAAYSQLEAFDRRSEAETRFLVQVSSLVAERVGVGKRNEVCQEIFAAADRLGVRRSSFVVLAVLSCLFEEPSGDPPSIGRRVLKPRKAYTEADAYNAICDLRHVEFAAAAQGYSQTNPLALCTSDRGIAMFWSALLPQGNWDVNGSAVFTLGLENGIFDVITEPELLDLKARLEG